MSTSLKKCLCFSELRQVFIFLSIFIFCFFQYLFKSTEIEMISGNVVWEEKKHEEAGLLVQYISCLQKGIFLLPQEHSDGCRARFN